MRVVMVNQFFWPDIAPTGQYLCDVARYLASEGHDVTVICSGGAYADAGSRLQDAPPVRIIRIPGFTYKRGSLARLASYSMFFAGAFWHELRVPRPDILLSLTTPPLLATAGSIVKKLRGTRHFIWEMDLFPDALVSLGTLSADSAITRLLAWMQNRARHGADGIIALGPCMRDRLLAHGVRERMVHVAENWADGELIAPGPERAAGTLNVFYSGNFGLAHDSGTIASAMRRFRNDSRFLFTFAGGGVGRNQLAKLCSDEGIRNASFLPYAGREEMNAHLAQADIGLVTERPACIGTVVPSKVYGLMAAGRPVLFIGPQDATPAILIRRFGCGWHVEPGNPEALVILLERLEAHREEIWACGRRGRAAFERHYGTRQGVLRVAAALGLAVESAANPEPASPLTYTPAHGAR